MSQHRSRIAGLLALLVVLVLAPTAVAAAPSALAPVTGKAKERMFGKHCGSASKAFVRASDRATCVNALSNLATGKSSSPRKACRALSRKKAKGSRTSAFARCVKAGKKLVKNRKRKGGGTAGASDPKLNADGEGDIPADGGVGDDGSPMGEAADDWDPNSVPADDSDPDPALDGLSPILGQVPGA